MSQTTALKPRIKLYHAEVLATRYLSLISPCLLKGEVGGSIRRRSHEVGDIEIIVVSKSKMVVMDLFGEEKPLSLLEEFYRKTPSNGIVMGGDRMKKMHFPFAGTGLEDFYPRGSIYQVDLFITNAFDYGRQLCIRTGSAFYVKVDIAKAWHDLGWRGTEHGLRRKEQCDLINERVWKIKIGIAQDAIIRPPAFFAERDLYAFLGKQWKAPEKRSWEEGFNGKKQ